MRAFRTVGCAAVVLAMGLGQAAQGDCREAPRALALDMGATLTSLRRVKQWKFELKEAVPFDKILNTSPADFASLVLPVSAVLRA